MRDGHLALRPVECYDFLSADCFEDKPYETRVLLGREDFLNTPECGFAHGVKLSRTMDWAKNSLEEPTSPPCSFAGMDRVFISSGSLSVRSNLVR